MKLIVAGGRELVDYELVKKTITIVQNKIGKFELVCGEARGADNLGKRYALENGLIIHSFPADWDKYKKSAGYIRNKQMAEFADALVAFWDGVSKGTKHMIDLANTNNLKIIVVKYDK